MLSYELVKFLHITSVIVFVSFLAATLLGKGSRGVTAVYGIASLLTLIFGFFLIGVKGIGMPGWIHGKLAIWVVLLAGVGIVNKRFPNHKIKALWGLFALVAAAVYLAVYK